MTTEIRGLLSHVAYVLGEHALEHPDASGYETLGMPKLPGTWGWGQFRQTAATLDDIKLAAARQCLASADLDPRSVDCVILCHANASALAGCTPAANRRLLQELDAVRAFPLVMGANGCSAMLTGIMAASGMIERRICSKVLVVTADVVAESETRFHRYALFSDASCACLVSDQVSGPGFEILASAHAAREEDMHPEAGFSSALAQETNRLLFSAAAIEARDIKRVFCNNVFLPVVMLKETEAGFEAHQVFVDNIARIAHCYAADALINLADYQKAASIAPGDLFVLAADSPGLRSTSLLRAR